MKISILKNGFKDLWQGVRAHALWGFLGTQDIRQRYRRSVLGPFWLTISTGIFVGALGLLWSLIFKIDIQTFLPFFAVGIVTWNFISGVLTEACTGFTQFESYIRQIRLPFTTYLLRILWRHMIIFAHNFAIILLVLAIFDRPDSWVVLAFLPGFFLVSLFVFFASGPLAIFCTRFRDLPQIVASLLMIVYYVTPILWRPDFLKSNAWIYENNLIFHLVELIRAPLLGSLPTVANVLWSSGAIGVMCLVYVALLGRYQNRIAYWV